MFNVVLCRICLRVNVGARDIPEYLIDLHDEICDYEVNENEWLKYCAICEHQLRKFHKFRLLCQLANKVLKKWNPKQKTVVPEVLQEKLPDFPLGISNNVARRRIYEYVYNDPDPDPDPDPDLESDLSLIKTETDDKDADTNLIIKDIQGKTMEIIDFKDFLQKNDSFDNIEVLEEEFWDENMISMKDKSTLNNQNDFILDVGHSVEVNGCNSDVSDSNDFILNVSHTEEINGCNSDIADNYDLSNMNKEKVRTKTKQIVSDNYDLSDKKKVKTKAKKISKNGVKIAEYNKLYDMNGKSIEKDIKIVKLVRAHQKFLRNKAKLKEKILHAFDTGQLNDLSVGDVKITKEMFNTVYERYDNRRDARLVTLKPDSPISLEKLKKFSIYLYRKYNPEYEKIFKIEYLNTDEEKLQEFNRRKHSRLYKEAPVKCELCYKGFVAQSFLDYHNKWHKVPATPNDVVCEICPMRFPTKNRYAVHRKNNHTVVYTCRQCPVVTYHFSVMFNHYNQHKGMDYQCQICLSVYANLTTLNNHRRQAHATSHICTTCARSFVSEKGLFFHKTQKHKDEPQADPAAAALCAECNITFDSRAAYETHARTAHSTRRMAEKYQCLYCKERFDSFEALRIHKLDFSHQRALRRKGVPSNGGTIKRKPFTGPSRKCPECNVEIPNIHPNSLYEHHLKAHPNVAYTQYVDSRDYLCEECGKTFLVYCYYRDHKNEHTGAKPYACKKCPARFSSRVKLVCHSERHRPPRYQCKQCGKLFLSAANMYTHRRIHINDRRYKCEVCFKSFIHAGSLREHINGVHNQIRRKRKLPRDKNLQ